MLTADVGDKMPYKTLGLWLAEEFLCHGFECLQLRETWAFRSRPKQHYPLCLIGGTHGDERSGPLALLQWIQDLPALPPSPILVIPILNPWGWNHCVRWWSDMGAGQVDLNLEFGQNSKSGIVRDAEELIYSQQPSLFVDLHEDNTTAYPYVFRCVEDKSCFADKLSAHIGAAKISYWDDCPEEEGSAEWWAWRCGCHVTTTVEAPSVSWSLEERVEYHLKVIEYAVSKATHYRRQHMRRLRKRPHEGGWRNRTHAQAP